jgi:hypothetical protein
MKPNNPNDKTLRINDDPRGSNSGMSNKESTSESSPSRLKAAAQSFARATVSFFRALPNFSQYIKDRYEFGPRIASVLWRAKDAHAKDPEKAIIPHVEDTLNESKEGNSALSKAVWNVLSDKLGDGQGGIKPGLSDDDVIERGGKITLDDLREKLRVNKLTDGFEPKSNTAKVHPDNEPDYVRYSTESERDSAYTDRSSSTTSDRRSMLLDFLHQAEEELDDAKTLENRLSKTDSTNDKPRELDPTDENSRSESDPTIGPKPD